MRILTVLGTRPEIIRLSQVIKTLDGLAEHIVVYTGQNYDPGLSEIFFRELDVRRPDFNLKVQATSFPGQAGQIIDRVGGVLAKVRPDRVLILGDTNSGLSAIVAARMGIPVYHMEAGNRCFDNRVPEETNRRVIDHCSAVLMPYTIRSKENLIREGIDARRIYVTGNPIFEVLESRKDCIEQSAILSQLGIQDARFFLATFHRSENVDNPDRLRMILDGLQKVSARFKMPMIVSLHPRTADRMASQGSLEYPSLTLLKPLGLFDFVRLERSARCVLSDSGTVQEECCIFGTPNVTLRDVTERPETIECGSNILSGCDPDQILRATTFVTESSSSWTPPPEYLRNDVSSTVARIILGYRMPALA